MQYIRKQLNRTFTTKGGKDLVLRFNSCRCVLHVEFTIINLSDTVISDMYIHATETDISFITRKKLFTKQKIFSNNFVFENNGDKILLFFEHDSPTVISYKANATRIW